MTIRARLKRLEQREPAKGCRDAIIVDDLIGPELFNEDPTILGLSEIPFDDSDSRVWMRKRRESLRQLRLRVGRDAGCLEGDFCLFDAVR
jgi:hypothetical protein